MTKLLAILGAVAPLCVSAATTSNPWSSPQPHATSAIASSMKNARSVHLNTDQLNTYFSDGLARGDALVLPRPDGGESEFVLEDSQTMPPELAARFPEIRSLRGSDGNGNHVRVDMSSLGFQAMVFDAGGIWVVRPETLGSTENYLSFFRRDLADPTRRFTCSVHGDSADSVNVSSMRASVTSVASTGAMRRNYRTAVAATGEYTQVFGGTVAGGQAAIVQAINRVNEVYERDFSIHLILVANNNLLVFTNPATDPYTNDDPNVMIDQNQSTIDNIIGAANYDLGHAFSTGAGGLAAIRATCTANKASGVTGITDPEGDAFYIDYVAHEMGHQFGGDHTFNSELGACSGNRAASSAYEPGSASTIMGYAGICDADDLQPHSDPYFHARSLNEIDSWYLGGGNCGTVSTNPDAAPVIAALTGYNLPAQTPFTLAGSASDADNDTLTYTWEEFDKGDAAALADNDLTTNPIMRTFQGTASPTRTIPRLDALLSGTPIVGETLPTTTRDMTFMLTVRDNHTGGGETAQASVVMHVTSAAGPFKVTSPDATSSWHSGTHVAVTWDVAGTTAAPVSCANVAIDLSSDGGNTFPTSLAASVPNNGSAQVLVPTQFTTHARVRVKCVGNVFFDISHGDAKISDLIFADTFGI